MFMIRKHLILLLLFQLQVVLGQKTLKQLINEVTSSENNSSYYEDNSGKKQGFSIQNETAILKKLELKPLDHSEYYITGKYEINNLLVLFFSEYWISEDTHFAILLDKSLNIIDRLEETAYSNDEGFYGVNSSVYNDIISVNIHNIYNIPEYLRKRYTITNKGFQPIKDQVIIRTPSGIRIRSKPTINSAIVTSAPNLKVFDYLSNDGNIDSTSVFENGKYLKNYWLQIAEKDSLQQLGYVFGAFAKRYKELVTNEYKVILDEISKQDFDLENNKSKDSPSAKKITDIKEIKNLLKEQLIGEDRENSYFLLKKVVLDNGKEISNDFEECDITGYFPEYHYLLLECGHSSEYIIDLKNGNDVMGNPDYYLPSPQNIFHLKGYYSGQGHVYFLEKNNKNSKPKYLFQISDLIPTDYIEKYFWKNDNTIFLKVENMYYKIILETL